MWPMISSGVNRDDLIKRKGHPRPTLLALAYSNSRFCFIKFTKPVHERNLQVPPNAARAINAALTRTVSVIACNSRMMIKLLPDIRT
jgi:hypothetical protein